MEDLTTAPRVARISNPELNSARTFDETRLVTRLGRLFSPGKGGARVIMRGTLDSNRTLSQPCKQTDFIVPLFIRNLSQDIFLLSNYQILEGQLQPMHHLPS